MHMDVPGGDQRQAALPRQFPEGSKLRMVIRPAMELRGDPGVSAEERGKPLGSVQVFAGNPEHERAAAGERLEIAARKRILSLAAAAPAERDERRNRAVCFSVRRKEDEPGFFENDFRTQDQLEPVLLGRLV